MVHPALCSLPRSPPFSHQMRSQFLVLLLLVWLSLATAEFYHYASAEALSSPANNYSPQPRTKMDNDTIYKISKQLCWNCIAESLQFLFAHNLVRARHWELPLAWDFQLEKYAKWWATQRRGDCKLEHSFPENDFKLGENVYWGSGSGWTAADAVSAWADEEKYYSYSTNSCEAGQMCGHYTQIVWKTTRRLGCARVICDDGDIFMTCNYDPPGNYIGERPY